MSRSGATSVNDSISYLRDFLNASGIATGTSDVRETRDAATGRLTPPSRAARYCMSAVNTSLLSHHSRRSMRRDSTSSETAAEPLVGRSALPSATSSFCASGFPGGGEEVSNTAWRGAASHLEPARSPVADNKARFGWAGEGRRQQQQPPHIFSSRRSLSPTRATSPASMPPLGTRFRYGKEGRTRLSHDAALPHAASDVLSSSSAAPFAISRTYSAANALRGGWRSSSSPWPWRAREGRASKAVSPPHLAHFNAAAVGLRSGPAGARQFSSRSAPSQLSLLWGWGGDGGGAGERTAASATPLPHRHRQEHKDSARGDEVTAVQQSISGSGGGSQHPTPSTSSAVASPRAASRAQSAHPASDYEEVTVEATVLPPPRTPPLRQPPPAPLTLQQSAATTHGTSQTPVLPDKVVELHVGSAGDAETHAANVCRIARYLKNFYAREASEAERGVESLGAVDVAALAQCFYIDLYRTVRQARRSVGLETVSFEAGDPTDNVLASVTLVPPPPQREDHRHSMLLPHNQPSDDLQPSWPQPSPPTAPVAEPERRRAKGNEGRDQDGLTRPQQEQQQHQSPLYSPLPPSSSASAPASPRPLSTTLRPQRAAGSSSSAAVAVTATARQMSHNVSTPKPVASLRNSHVSAAVPSEKMRETYGGSGGDDDDTGVYRAPNSQLAFSGGGTHCVQIIQARLPAFRNDDAATADAANRSTSASFSRGEHHSLQLSPSRSHAASVTHSREALVQGRLSSKDASRRSIDERAAAARTYQLDSEDSVTDAMSSLALAATPSPPYVHPHRRDAASAPQQHHVFTRGGTDPSRPPAFSGDANFAAAPKTVASSAGRRDNNGGGARQSGGGLTLSRLSRGHSAPSIPGRRDYSSSVDGDDAWAGASRGRDERPGRAADRRPIRSRTSSSGIVKHPLKDLMPLLRSRPMLAVKYISGGRRPHLRLFQILDCTDVYHGKEVLMPHLTWVTPEGTYKPDGPTRAKRLKYGSALPTGLSLSQEDVPYETALNLIHLEAVYVGVGRGILEPHLSLFHFEVDRSGDAIVVDHNGRAVANDMCAVFVFSSRAVALAFLCEEDRQLCVGVMMGVVERNRSLKT